MAETSPVHGEHVGKKATDQTCYLFNDYNFITRCHPNNDFDC